MAPVELRKFPLALVFVVVALFAGSFGSYRFVENLFASGYHVNNSHLALTFTLLFWFLLGAGFGVPLGYMRHKTVGAMIGALIGGAFVLIAVPVINMIIWS